MITFAIPTFIMILVAVLIIGMILGSWFFLNMK